MEDSQEVDDTLQRGFSGNNTKSFLDDILHPSSSFPIDSGVKDCDMDTDGVPHHSLLTKLSLGEDAVDQARWRSRGSPPRSPSLKSTMQATPSPVTPLDLPCSPKQHLKKMRSNILEQVRTVRLMLAAADKNSLTDVQAQVQWLHLWCVSGRLRDAAVMAGG